MEWNIRCTQKGEGIGFPPKTPFAFANGTR
jgi:hypothetical protein